MVKKFLSLTHILMFLFFHSMFLPHSLRLFSLHHLTELQSVPLLARSPSTNRKYPPLSVDKLEEEMNRRMADDNKLFREEFNVCAQTHTNVVLQSWTDRLEISPALEWHKNMASKIHNIHLWCWCVSPRHALGPCELVGLAVSLLCRRCLYVPFRPHVMLPRRRRIRRRTDMSTSCPVRLSHNLSPNRADKACFYQSYKAYKRVHYVNMAVINNAGSLIISVFNFLHLFSDDHSRVYLTSLEGVPDSDYINASFINVSPQALVIRSRSALLLKFWLIILF